MTDAEMNAAEKLINVAKKLEAAGASPIAVLVIRKAARVLLTAD